MIIYSYKDFPDNEGNVIPQKNNIREVQEESFSAETKYNNLSNSYYEKTTVILDSKIECKKYEYVFINDNEYKIVGINIANPLSIGSNLKVLLLEG